MSTATWVEVRRLSVVTAARAALVLVIGGAALVVDGSGLSGDGPGWLWLAATVLVAASVIASRSWVERLADRVAYGPDGDPYSALSAFVQRISDTVAVDDVLPRVAQTVTQAAHSSAGEVRLWLPDGAELREAWPVVPAQAGAAMVKVPLQRRGEQVGVLGVAADTAEMTGNTKVLLDRLAGTAGLALANVRLAYDLRHRIADSLELADRLQRSRQRLLDAAAEQTERFADQVDEQVLTRLSNAGAALDRVSTGDPAGLETAVVEATAALESLRDIAAGIFPPTLAANGLQVALETFALRYDGRVHVSGRGPGDRLPSPVETAAYFCSTRVIDDCAGRDGGTVQVDIEQSEHMLRVGLASDGRPSAATIELLQDRVEATHGVLGRRTVEERSGHEHVLTLAWDVVSP
jgi:hypothetical protein